MATANKQVNYFLGENINKYWIQISSWLKGKGPVTDDTVKKGCYDVQFSR